MHRRRFPPTAFTFLAISNLFAQPQFERHDIELNLNSAYWVFSTDIDRDGDSDLVTAAYNGIDWWDNNGNGGFTRNYLGRIEGAWTAYADDIDGDGDIDIIGGGPTTDVVELWINNGNQSFSRRLLDDQEQDPESVFSADLDGDGDQEILVAAWESEHVLVYQNNGDSFTKYTIDGLLPGAHSVQAGDMDGDGDMDVVACGASKTRWYRNNGNFSFGRADANGDGGWSVFVIDVDNDGDQDILRSQRSTGDIDWLRNNGSGSFSELTIEAGFGQCWSVAGGDIDGDGDTDVAAAGFDANTVKVWLNNGGGSFGAGISLGNVNTVRSVFIADIDGDRDGDVVAAIREDRDLVWYESLGRPASLTVTKPNNGDALFAGFSYAIEWNSTGDIGNVRIEVSYDGGASWDLVAAATDNDGLYDWIAPDQTSSAVRVRLTAVSDVDVNDASNANSTIYGTDYHPLITSFFPDSGGVGLEMEIVGENFIGVTEVLVGDMQADFDIVSTSRIRAILPEGAETGALSISNPHGSVFSASEFVVVPVPEILSFSPESGIPGSVVTLQGMHFADVSEVLLRGVAAPVIATDSDTQIRAVIPAGVSDGPLKALSRFGGKESSEVFDVEGPTSGDTFLEFAPVGDAHINFSSPTSNYSGDQNLRVQSGAYWSYLQFNVQGVVEDVVSSRLELLVTNASDAGGTLFPVSNTYGTSEGIWEEDGLKVTNAPIPRGGGIDSIGLVQVGDVARFDVTSIVNGDSLYSFVISSSSSDDVRFGSSESTVVPKLILELGTFPDPAPFVIGFEPAFGESGTGVTIVGKYFTNTSEVRFGDRPVSLFEVVSDTVLHAIAPDSVVPGIITVVTPNGNGQSVTMYRREPERTLQLLAPVFGDTLIKGSASDIVWTSTGNVSAVQIEYILDGGLQWLMVSEPTPNVGTFRWLLPDSESTNVRLRISDALDPTIADTSDVFFILRDFSIPEVFSFVPDKGYVGTEVRIYGRAFSQVQGIAFGDVDADSFRVESDSLIITWVPPGAGKGGFKIKKPGKEGASKEPFVVLTPAQASLLPVADSFVRSNKATMNFGSEPFLEVLSSQSRTSSAFLKFSIPPEVGQLVDARLQMHLLQGEGGVVEVFLISNDYARGEKDWREEFVDWTNAPAFESLPFHSFEVTATDSLFELDVFQLISGPGAISFGMKAAGDAGMLFTSREHGNPPRLIISYPGDESMTQGTDTVTDVLSQSNGIPGETALQPNFPNPFNIETRMSYSLHEPAQVSMTIYNLLGQRVRALLSGQMPAGKHSIRWNGRDEYAREVPSGIYVVRFSAGDVNVSRKVMVLK